MIKTVIFDLDGLLIDSELIAYKIYQELLKPYGYTMTLEDYGENYSGKTAVKNVTAVIEKYQLPYTVEGLLEKVFQLEREFLQEGVELKPGAEALLQYLKEQGYQIAMASSSVEERALKILDEHGIRSCFDVLVFGYEVEKGKPAPDIFLKASEKAGEKPENCLVLEDSEAGIRAAYAAQIPVICIPDLKKPAEEYRKMTAACLTSLHEVIPYLEAQRQERPF